MSKSGYTLLEMLIVLGLLSILSSIAVIQYRGTMLSSEKRELKDSALLYATRFDTCIKVLGGWTTYRSTKGTETCPTGKTNPCIPENYCKEVPPPENAPPKTRSTQPSKKLNYTCPAGATCEFFTHGNPAPSFRRHCLSIKKEVSGKKLQVVTVIPYDNPSDYKIFCAELSGDYRALGGQSCKRHHGYNNNKGFKPFAECWKKDP